MGNVKNPITTEKAHFWENEQTITSLEVAEMVGKRHDHLIRDIKKYIQELNAPNFGEVEKLAERKIASSDFFVQNTYLDAKREERPCYNVTKKGCEFIAHKLTGVKGTIFTAKYINRFHDMEERIQNENGAVVLNGLSVVKFIADDLRVSESSRLFMYENYCKDVGIPTGFLPKYTDNGSREQCSATELLKRNGCEIKTATFNQCLIADGYMELRERPTSKGGTKEYKALTDKGLRYGVNLVSNKNQKECQPYYYADTFMELYNKVTA